MRKVDLCCGCYTLVNVSINLGKTGKTILVVEAMRHIKLPINNGLRMERNDFIASPLLLGEIIFGYFLAKRNETNDKKQT